MMKTIILIRLCYRVVQHEYLKYKINISRFFKYKCSKFWDNMYFLVNLPGQGLAKFHHPVPSIRQKY